MFVHRNQSESHATWLKFNVNYITKFSQLFTSRPQHKTSSSFSWKGAYLRGQLKEIPPTGVLALHSMAAPTHTDT